MCFSATASFGASIMLTGMGAISMVKAKSTPLKVLAIIPFVFSVQQFAEGWVWLSLTIDSFSLWKRPSMYLFLFFAEVAWPICISFAMMLLENNGRQKKVLRFLFFTGILLSFSLAYSLYYYPVDAKVLGNHVLYSVGTPINFKLITNLAYFVTAVLPPFLSTVRRAWLIGAILLVSYIVTKLFYADFIISVWCYFATMISVIIVWLIWDNNIVITK